MVFRIPKVKVTVGQTVCRLPVRAHLSVRPAHPSFRSSACNSFCPLICLSVCPSIRLIVRSPPLFTHHSVLIVNRLIVIVVVVIVVVVVMIVVRVSVHP